MIRNWAHDVDGSTDAPVGDDIKKQWGLAGRFVVGYFGNLGRAHEYQTVLAAMRALAGESHIVFLFVGGGIRMDALRRIAEQEGLPNFIYREYVPRSLLTAALKVPDAHLVILRPRLESLIVPSKFAAAAARPVIYIGSRHGDIGSTIETERCGEVVSPGASGKLVNVIWTLSKDSDVVAEMGSNARRSYFLSLLFRKIPLSLSEDYGF